MNILLSLSALITAGAMCAGAATVTFNEQIAPIVYEKCAGCHRPGESGPFPLISYQDVAKRGKLIATVTATRYMPPWHAQPASVLYRDERRLTDAQLSLLQEWVKQGMPEGDPKKATPLPAFPAGWQLGKPDLVVTLPKAYTIPAGGPDIYRDFLIPIGLPEDKWIRAIEVRPTAAKAVHHMLYYGDPTGSLRQTDGAAGVAGFSGIGLPRGTFGLGTWAAGTQPHFLPEGVARPFPKGSDLVIQEHFHPTGKEQVEKTAVGIYFAKSAPDRRMLSIQLPPDFGLFAGVKIAPGDRSYTVRDSYVLPTDVDAFAASAHAHYLGKSMKLTATLPSGETKVLLWIKDWDFAWQDGYVFSDFISLPKGTRLDGEVTWDNSAQNPQNPSNPPVAVGWGEQSRDEMGSVTLEMLPHRQEERAILTQALAERMKQITQAAFERDPTLKGRVRDMSSGRSAVFQAGESK